MSGLEFSPTNSVERRAEPANPAALDSVIFSFPRPLKDREKPRTRETSLRETLSAEFQASLSEAFRAVGALEPNARSAAIIKELNDYRAAIDERLDRRFTEKTLDISTVKKLLKSGESERSHAYNQMLNRMLKETSFLDELAHVGTLEILRRNSPVSLGIGSTAVYFYPKQQWLKHFGRRTAGLYHTGNDRISVRGKAPTQARSWLSLASRGELPREVPVLHHELVHAGQDKPGRQDYLATLGRGAAFGGMAIGLLALSAASPVLTIVLCGSAAAAIIAACRRSRQTVRKVPTRESLEAPRGRCAKIESQAWLSHMSLPGTNYNGGIFNYDFLKSTVKNTLAHSLVYGLGSESKELVAHALDLLYSLKLLGVRENELGGLVRDTRARLGTKALPTLEKRLDKELKARGLDKESAPAVLRALGGKAELEYYFQRARAKEIASQELESFTRRIAQ